MKVFVSGKLTAWNKGSAIDDIVLYEREADDTDSSEENQKGYTISVNQTEVAVEMVIQSILKQRLLMMKKK